ncbi:MAG: AAA family ATPase [Saprospiraceae bacterium]|nr:AAA family ATPase [Saprospiraceae bacterium]
MEKINYPLLCYELGDGHLLGMLVGSEVKAVDKDIAGIKSTIQDHLHKQYKKSDYYPTFDIVQPRMKVLDIKIRPTYRDQTGAYPLSYEVNVPVAVIYGETEHNYYDCHLPLFNYSFYYYDPKQFESLAHHFAKNYLDQLQPTQLYQYLRYKKPQLEIVSLRVNTRRDNDWGGFHFQREYRTLQRLCERFPFSKGVRKNITSYPEAAWELENKVDEVFDKLINTRSNVLIVGNHGVGKSAILTQVIKKVTSKKQNLEFSFWQIMPQRITASSKYLGEWQETVESLVEELQSANGILWVVDMVQLMQQGGEGPEDSVASFLMSFLQQNKLQLIGEATPEEVESMRRLLPGFVESFQVVQVDELPEHQIQLVLQKFGEYAQKNLQIDIQPDAMHLAYRLLLRYYPYESFPGKGIKFLGQCISEADISKKNLIQKSDVIANFTKQTGLPELFLRDDLLLDQQELHDYFSSRIIGQESAVDKICSIVKIYKAGLNNPYKPINTLLFTGPTGVGKTASAKALAGYFFGKGQQKSPLIRVDMSEFQHPMQISRLIGEGREVGQLVKDIRERPFSVLLLDEVEKANPAIFDALLTVLDEGMLVDAYGRVTNFRNTIIIMTSNLGASNRSSIGFTQTTSAEDVYTSAIMGHFRPEFVNRIDGIVHFKSLNQEDILKITRKELDELKQREGFQKRNLEVVFSQQLIKYLVDIGFDEKYGARPLQRAIEQNIVTPVANWMLANPKAKNRKIEVDYQKGIIIK